MVTFEVLSIPAPFLLGPVNVYLIKSDPVTLIDCGPNYSETKAALIKQLSSHGLGLENIKQIIITHAHSDHYGMAAEIQRVTGAIVYMHNKEISKTRFRLDYQKNLISYLAYAGTPDVYCKKQERFFNSGIVEPPEEITAVEDGHIFTFDGVQLEGILTPGHSAGHLSLFERNDGLLFAGDTVLEKLRQKPLLEPLPEHPLQREKNLLQYIDSLNCLKQLDIKCILPGHGDPILNVAEVLHRLDVNIQERKEEIKRAAYYLKVFTPYELVTQIFAKRESPLELSMAVSEVLGYLDLLEAEGKVVQQQGTVCLTYSCI